MTEDGISRDLGAIVELPLQVYGVCYRHIPGFPGFACGSDGSFWSVKSGSWRPLKRQMRETRKGKFYWCISLYDDSGKKRLLQCHRVIARTHLGPRPPGLICRHLNDDSLDLRVENLTYGTYSDNMRDSIRNGRQAFGERSGRSRLREADVVEMRNRFAAGGVDTVQLARDYGTDSSSVSKIIKGISWSRAGGPRSSIGLCSGERHSHAGLSDAKIVEIRSAVSSGRSIAAVAEEYGCTYERIWSIAVGKTRLGAGGPITPKKGGG